jgi:hypothetical protein
MNWIDRLDPVAETLFRPHDEPFWPERGTHKIIHDAVWGTRRFEA